MSIFPKRKAAPPRAAIQNQQTHPNNNSTTMQRQILPMGAL